MTATPWYSIGRRWLSWGLVGKIGSLAGLVATIVGLLFTFFPNLRPGHKSDAPSGKIELANVNERAPLREYLIAERQQPGSLSQAILSRLGVLTTVRYSSTGLKGKTLSLDVAMTNRNGELVCGHRYDIDAGSGGQLTFRVWTPFPASPPAGDAYDLHVTLFPPGTGSTSLDAADHDGIPAPPAGSAAPVPLDVC